MANKIKYLKDYLPILQEKFPEFSIEDSEVESIEKEVQELVKTDFENAILAEDPKSEDVYNFDFAPTPVTEEKGEREDDAEICER